MPSNFAKKLWFYISKDDELLYILKKLNKHIYKTNKWVIIIICIGIAYYVNKLFLNIKMLSKNVILLIIAKSYKNIKNTFYTWKSGTDKPRITYLDARDRFESQKVRQLKKTIFLTYHANSII